MYCLLNIFVKCLLRKALIYLQKVALKYTVYKEHFVFLVGFKQTSQEHTLLAAPLVGNSLLLDKCVNVL